MGIVDPNPEIVVRKISEFGYFVLGDLLMTQKKYPGVFSFFQILTGGG